MAKRTPRSEADDTTATPAAPPARTRKRSRAGGKPAAGEQTTAASPEVAEPSDTFAARAEAGGERPDDPSTSETRSESMASEPSEEDIRRRAYQRYLDRGAAHGADFDDWLEAERELKGKNDR